MVGSYFSSAGEPIGGTYGGSVGGPMVTSYFSSAEEHIVGSYGGFI